MLSGPQSIYKPAGRNWILWMVMAFQAGAINAGSFLACRRFVTHTTGFATVFGTEFGAKNWRMALSMMIVPIFFVLGAMISAFCVDRRIAEKKTPHDRIVFTMIPCLLLVVSLMGQLEFFGSFGGLWEDRAWEEFVFLALLALTMGLQNASISSVSAGSIRTTHLTGITTDIGIGIVRMISKSYSNLVKSAEKTANLVRFGIVSSFIGGSTAGALLFVSWKFTGFLLPFTTSLGILAYSFSKRKVAA